MAIGIHIVKITSAGRPVVERVKEKAGVANSDGNPTVDEYIALEAADDYLVTFMNDSKIITADVADMNAAS